MATAASPEESTPGAGASKADVFPLRQGGTVECDGLLISVIKGRSGLSLRARGTQ